MACCTMAAGQQGGDDPCTNSKTKQKLYILKISEFRVIPIDTGAGAGSMAL